ncbi:MAG: hypothetical protein GKS05_11175 [Nitrospirales bacterium]|nr:hypothetical protein [Nitrospirales bacterium]
MYQIPRCSVFKIFPIQLLIGCVCLLVLCGTEVWGEDVSVRSYTLQEVVALALTHNPAIQLGKGFIDEKAGEELTSQAYPNPSLGIQSGHGQVLDPTGPSLTERYVSLSQPLEWPGTRMARQKSAHAQVGSAEASFEEIQLNVKAQVKCKSSSETNLS